MVNTVPIMTNAVITIQNAISNGLIERYSSSSNSWANFSDACAVLVVVGVFAEILELASKVLKAGLELRFDFVVKRTPKIKSWLAWFKKYEHWLEIWGFAFWIIIVAALMGEVLGTRIARHFDSLVIGELTGQSRDATKAAGEAIERAANTESNNLVLKAKVLELEAKARWRTIMPEEKTNFIELTKNIPKLPIRVRMGANAPTEVLGFSSKIREMLDAGGFTEPDTNLALAEWPPTQNLVYNGGTPDMPSVMFLNNPNVKSGVVDLQDAKLALQSFPNFSSNSTVVAAISMTNTDSDMKAFVTTNELGKPILNLPMPSRAAFKVQAFLQVEAIFNSMGISAGWITATNIPEGAYEIFIDPKF